EAVSFTAKTPRKPRAPRDFSIFSWRSWRFLGVLAVKKSLRLNFKTPCNYWDSHRFHGHGRAALEPEPRAQGDWLDARRNGHQPAPYHRLDGRHPARNAASGRAKIARHAGRVAARAGRRFAPPPDSHFPEN